MKIKNNEETSLVLRMTFSVLTLLSFSQWISHLCSWPPLPFHYGRQFLDQLHLAHKFPNWKKSHRTNVQVGHCSLWRCVDKEQLHSQGSASANDSFNPPVSRHCIIQRRCRRIAQVKDVWKKRNQNIQQRVQLQRTPKCVCVYLHW